jgi:hypothetical protein
MNAGHSSTTTERIMKVLMVLTSHDQLGNTGRKTGFWLEELAAPYSLSPLSRLRRDAVGADRFVPPGLTSFRLPA